MTKPASRKLPRAVKKPEADLGDFYTDDLPPVKKLPIKPAARPAVKTQAEMQALADLEKLLPTLKVKYGAKAVLLFDAGYNNISVDVVPSKKIKR